VGMGVMPMPDRFRASFRASIFASFGAGIGFSLAILVDFSLLFLIEYSWGNACISFAACSATIFEFLAKALGFLFGAALSCLVASVIGCLFALPMAVLSGGLLVGIAKDNKAFLSNRWMILALGALLGILWWIVLIQLQVFPYLASIGAGAFREELGAPPQLLATIFNRFIIYPAFAGLVSADLYRRWMLSEVVE
jgi:hypothetical protein